MSGGGGKGGSKTTTIEMDPELEKYARDALNKASAAAAIPYMANRGGVVAALTPAEKAAMKGVNRQNAAYGLETAEFADMPEMVNAGGIKAYSASGAYDKARNQSISKGMQQDIAKLFAPAEGGDYDMATRMLNSGLFTDLYKGGAILGKEQKAAANKKKPKKTKKNASVHDGGDGRDGGE